MSLFAHRPSHGLIVHGSAGSGKEKIAEELLNDSFKGPLVMKVQPEKDKSVGIESVRRALAFLKIKSDESSTRALLILNAEVMTDEAQNALLKTLEEPASGSVIMLVAESPDKLLPTIRSRASELEVLPLSVEEATAAYTDENVSTIQKNLLLSEGGAELFEALMQGTDHPLLQEIGQAKEFLQATLFERLKQIDELKDAASTLISALARIAKSTLQNKNLSSKQRKRWIQIYELSVEGLKQLEANVSKKAVLLHLTLSLQSGYTR